LPSKSWGRCWKNAIPDSATTRDINKAQIYAWKKGIKTLYYIRLRQLALEGTEIEGCVSCAL
jgi:ribonucleoside-diphosphate reductase alpha chain